MSLFDRKFPSLSSFFLYFTRNLLSPPLGSPFQAKGVFHCQQDGRFFCGNPAILNPVPAAHRPLYPALFSLIERGDTMKEEQQHDPWGVSALSVLRALAFFLTAILAFYGLNAPRAAAADWTDEAVVPTLAAAKERRTVIPMGRAVGIKLFSDGVMVVGLSDISTDQGNQSPAKTCGLHQGDIITHINSEEVDSIEEVQTLLQSISGEKMSIRAMRGEKQIQLTAQAVQCSADGTYKLGAWIRDSMAGIGTMTFYDPLSGTFGALGHGINDIDTALLMPLQSGSIMYASVTDVKKGLSGTPGELHGAFQVDQDLGALYANTSSGVFGSLSDQSLLKGTQALEVATRQEVKLGPATILSNIAGEQVEEYTVEITKVYPGTQGETRDLMLKVTDPRLLETTGGIVQGMSGSPILQNGRIVGAVTHVLVNDPTSGYGILAEQMLTQAQANTPSDAMAS